MARPKLGESDSKRLQLVITEDEVKAIDEWQFSNRVPSRSEAVRRLCQAALRTDETLVNAGIAAEQFLTNLGKLIEQDGLDSPEAFEDWFDDNFEGIMTMAVGAATGKDIFDGLRGGISFDEVMANLEKKRADFEENMRVMKRLMK